MSLQWPIRADSTLAPEDPVSQKYIFVPSIFRRLYLVPESGKQADEVRFLGVLITQSENPQPFQIGSAFARVTLSAFVTVPIFPVDVVLIGIVPATSTAGSV